MHSRVSLRDFIQHIRTELVEATAAGEGQQLRFGVESVDLELKVQVTQSDAGEAGIKFWVLNAGAKLKDEDVTTQTLKLKLVPGWVDGEGNVQRGWLIGD
jgi:hypothetical protein